jgi:hypothetical protein
MPRQTQGKTIQFPEGFNLAIDAGDGFYDMGLLAGGATATLNWDEFYLDAGNYEGLVDKSKNPTVDLSPSAFYSFNPEVVARMFPGFASSADAGGSPTAGNNVTYAGTSNQLTLTRVSVRLTHFPSDPASHTLVEDDITALDESGTNNQLVTIPKTTFTNSLPWTENVHGYVLIDGMDEVPYSDRDDTDSQGNFCTDENNLYLIVADATYADLAAAKTGEAGTEVEFYDDVDWQFIAYNCKVQPGGQFNFKGVNEDGLDEITVSFQGIADPANSYRLFKLFKAS